MCAEPSQDKVVGWTTLAMAVLATVSLDQATLEPGASRAIALAWSAGILVLPAIIAARRLMRIVDAASAPSPAAGSQRHGSVATISLVLLFAFPFAWGACQLVLGGRAPMAEVALMTALRNVGLGLAAMVHRRAYTRLSALVSLFLATVSSSVGGDAGQAVLLPLSGFGVSGILWLIMVYWEGLGPKLNMPAGARVPLAGAGWALAIVALVVAIGLLGPIAGGDHACGPGSHLGRY